MDFDLLNEKLISCTQCERLVAWRKEVAEKKRRVYMSEVYWGKPVPGFGDKHAKVIVVGLAPGAHGSNRTGRMFTGDASGVFLYRALYKAGFSNQMHSSGVGDGLSLKDIFITAVCRCVPPGNKPSYEEIYSCLPWLKQEVSLLENIRGFVVLGKIAMDNVLNQFFQEKFLVKPKFIHNAFYQPSDKFPWLLSSYHPSQQNTQTGRLTEEMFDAIWLKVRMLIEQ